MNHQSAEQPIINFTNVALLTTMPTKKMMMRCCCHQCHHLAKTSKMMTAMMKTMLRWKFPMTMTTMGDKQQQVMQMRTAEEEDNTLFIAF
jgi:hypothetical protein